MIISASILSANFAALGEDVAHALAAGADRIHIDVMDQHYVPVLTIGPLVVEALQAYGIQAPLDVHLMVEPVDLLITAFAKLKVQSICFHPEASSDIHHSLALIKSFGVEAGLALNPETPIEVLNPFWDKLDRVLVMAVQPGYGGQSFIPETLVKIKALRQKINEINPKIVLEVDGGIHPLNIHEVRQAGAEMCVVGSALFKVKNRDYAQVIRALKLKS